MKTNRVESPPCDKKSGFIKGTTMLFFALMAGSVCFYSAYLFKVASKNYNRIITIKGLAQETVFADKASLSLSFSTRGDDVKEMYAQMNGYIQQINDFFQQFGIDSDSLSMWPTQVEDTQRLDRYDEKEKTSTRPKYHMRKNIVFKTKDTDLVKKIESRLDQLIQMGVPIENPDVTYALTGFKNMRGPILKKSMENAIHAASSIAQAGGFALGDVQDINQGPMKITSPQGIMTEEYDQSHTHSAEKVVRVVSTVKFRLISIKNKWWQWFLP